MATEVGDNPGTFFSLTLYYPSALPDAGTLLRFVDFMSILAFFSHYVPMENIHVMRNSISYLVSQSPTIPLPCLMLEHS